MCNLTELEKTINYSFKDKDLLKEALTHPSVLDSDSNYERLEFLGDAVLNLVITSLLSKTYPEDTEGMLAKKRAHLVCTASLVGFATELDLGKYLALALSEEQCSGREKNSNLENAFEALVGAIYEDADFEVSFEFISKLFEKNIANLKEAPSDPKSLVQEWAQKNKLPLPNYEVIERTGPDHEPKFLLKLVVETRPDVIAIGKNKKQAEINAAKKFLEALNGE